MILESDPPRRLACTWHTITPERAAAVGMDGGGMETCAVKVDIGWRCGVVIGIARTWSVQAGSHVG